jgi:hypothetical protein
MQLDTRNLPISTTSAKSAAAFLPSRNFAYTPGRHRRDANVAASYINEKYTESGGAFADKSLGEWRLADLDVYR